MVKFGAFLELTPGREGFYHISQLYTKRVENVGNFVKVGDTKNVKVIEIDIQGKVNVVNKRVGSIAFCVLRGNR